MPSRFGPGFIPPPPPDFNNVLAQALGELERKKLLDEERELRAEEREWRREDRETAAEERAFTQATQRAQLAQSGIVVGPNRPMLEERGEPVSFQPRVAGMGVANAQPVAGESGFRSWYAGQASRLGLDPDPDNPLHYYDWRAAYRSGAEADEAGHWPSEYKRAGHPNLVVGGIDTRTGTPALAGALEREGARGPQPQGRPRIKGEFVPEMLSFTPQMVERPVAPRPVADPRYQTLVAPEGRRPGVYQRTEMTEPYLRQQRTEAFTRALEPRFGESAADVAAALAMGREALPVSMIEPPFEDQLGRLRREGELRNELAVALAEEQSKIIEGRQGRLAAAAAARRGTTAPTSAEAGRLYTLARETLKALQEADEDEIDRILSMSPFRSVEEIQRVLRQTTGTYVPPPTGADAFGEFYQSGGAAVGGSLADLDARIDELLEQGLEQDDIEAILRREFPPELVDAAMLPQGS